MGTGLFQCMEVIVEHMGAVQFEIRARQHSIVSDQPLDAGGFDEGMTPPELLLASLGSCAGYYVAQYLKTRNMAPSGTRVRVSAEKAKDPVRMDDFQIEVDVPAACTAQDRLGIERAVHKCLIHNTLLHPPAISLKINEEVLVA
jgi:putative redox protein